LSWSDYTVRSGLYRYGCISYYDADKKPIGLWWPEKKRFVAPSDPEYALVCFIFRSTLITVATIQDHLVKVHWIVANSGVVNTECHLGELHLLRRFMKPHIFGTVSVNYASTSALAPIGGLAYRVFGFDDKSWFPMVANCFANFRYQSLSQLRDFRGLSPDDIKGMPFYEDGLELESIIERYVTGYLDLIYPQGKGISEDADLKDFWRGYETYFGTMRDKVSFDLGDLNRENLVKLLTYHIFWSTGGHQYIGAVIEYLTQSGALAAKLHINQESAEVRTDVITLLQSVALMVLTSAPEPMMIDDWEHLWKDKQLKLDEALHIPINDNLKAYQDALNEISHVIDNRNTSRPQKFDAFNPKLIKSSVSV
jgi:hypothetical protein